MIAFLKTIIYIPLYNVLILVLNILPTADIGIAVIALTVIVKIILYPLASKQSIAQLVLKQKQPELDAIKEKYKQDREQQALKTMEFYKKNNINPFTSFFILLIQIPIIYSLYHIFLHSGLPQVDQNLLYSFIKIPEAISMNFLGFIDISQKNLIFALIAGITSYFQMKITAPGGQTASGNTNKSTADDLSKIMALQMKFFMPILVFVISWRISGVIALYWVISNLLGIAQDLYLRKKLDAKINYGAKLSNQRD